MQNQSANPRNVVLAPTACGGAVPGAQGQFSTGRLRASFRVNDAAVSLDKAAVSLGIEDELDVGTVIGSETHCAQTWH